MRILFISTHNFATNPRLVKEIDLALENNYEVSVVGCSFNNWSKENNEKIKQRLVSQINYYEVNGTRSPVMLWLCSTFCFFLSKLMLNFFPVNQYFLSLYSNKRSWLLLQRIKKIHEKIHLVVAHNPGSFYPAMKFAQRFKIPFGIDLEDYHPGETNNKKDCGYLKSLLKLIVPKASYITAASPLIGEETKKITGKIASEFKIILNYFSKKEFTAPVLMNSDKLKVVWFSQNISFGRGLEEVIPAIKKLKDIELHLYGSLNAGFYRIYLEDAENIFIHKTLPQADLHKILSRYDIGVAIEKTSSNFNREICLTNKLIAYFQSGLFIVASNTMAQKNFIKKYPENGILISLNAMAIENTFQNLFTDRKAIRNSAKDRYIKAANYCWENESKELLAMWQQVLN